MATTNHLATWMTEWNIPVLSEPSEFIEIFHFLKLNWFIPDSFILPNHNLGPLCVQQQAGWRSELTFYSKIPQMNRRAHTGI